MGREVAGLVICKTRPIRFVGAYHKAPACLCSSLLWPAQHPLAEWLHWRNDLQAPIEG